MCICYFHLLFPERQCDSVRPYSNVNERRKVDWLRMVDSDVWMTVWCTSVDRGVAVALLSRKWQK